MLATLDIGGDSPVLLADHISGLKVRGSRHVQEAAYVADTADDDALDDSYKDYFDLGNKSLTITFSGSILHADCEAAIAHLLGAATSYPSDKMLSFTSPDGVRYDFVFGVLNSWEANFRGRRSYHNYTATGAYLRALPEAAIQTEDGQALLTEDGQPIEIG